MSQQNSRFHFPKWVNLLRPGIALALVGGPLYVGVLLYMAGKPTTTDVGYAPEQPLPYSHALHVGQLGIDCRYCHTTVESEAFAAIPPTQTCMNCHAKVRANSDKLVLVRESYATGMPIPWVKIHDLPDYAHFNHASHVRAGVSCVSCHGRVDQMEVVYQVEPLNMGWCLDCHRNPEPHLRPVEFVTQLDWQPEGDPAALGARLRAERNINPKVDCSTCHR
ncbi:MAG: cytochrome c3 family protein [Acidobacteria bacterium]|nr:cytochrome c3 family protein [Acidobacteriota bacterium]